MTRVMPVESREDLVAYLPEGYGLESVPAGVTVLDGYSNPRTAPSVGGFWDLWHIADRETNTHVDYIWIPSGSQTVRL